MRALCRGVAVLLAWHAAYAEVVRFDTGTPGSLPAGWTVAMTHTGGAPQWQLAEDPTAPSPPLVFAQTSQDRTAGRFPLAVWDGTSIRNGAVSVAFKTVSGAIDQAAGIIWRYDLRYELCGQLLDLHAQAGFTLVYITHSKDEARMIGTRTIALRAATEAQYALDHARKS